MKMFSVAKVAAVAARSDVLWNGGPPPPGDFWEFLHDFIRDVGKFMSVSDAMEKHNIDGPQWEFLTSRSPWFCQRLNAIAEIKRADAELSAMQAAIGHRVRDEEGKIVTDADGIPIRRGRDGNTARFLLERADYQTLTGGGISDQQSDAPPLLPSNVGQQRQLQIDDCRVALDALRPAVRAGDRQAIDTFTKVQDRLAKLQGTDAPKATVTFINQGSSRRLSDDELLAIATGQTLIQGPDGVYEAAPDDASS